MRDTIDYDLAPDWFFTSPQIDSFLARALPGWDTNAIGLDLEAFGLAGCEMFRE